MWFIESCRYNRVEAEALLEAPAASARDKRRRRPTQQIIAPLSSENGGVREQGDGLFLNEMVILLLVDFIGVLYHIFSCTLIEHVFGE